MSEPTVPGQVYREAERAAHAASGTNFPIAFESPAFRAAVESAYRDGYGRGRDDEAAGLDLPKWGTDG